MISSSKVVNRVSFLVSDAFKRGRRQILQFIKSPIIGLKLARLRRQIIDAKWQAARQEAIEIGHWAAHKRDARLMEEIGISLQRLGEYRFSSQLRLESRRLQGRFPPNEWNGEKTDFLLVNLVENGKQPLGMTHLAAHAVKRSAYCVIIAEGRLVPLVKRSFPDANVISEPQSVPFISRADAYASINHLAYLFAKDEEQIRRNFIPLKADPSEVNEFRLRYREYGKKPLVGISWTSSALSKDMPPLNDWKELLRDTDAIFVSLQYGNIEQDIATLRVGSGRTIIQDNTVDQLTQMDRFAAQISALDLVISVSNTGAHLTGTLNVPMIVLVDDRFRKIWPVISDRIPWYPRTQILFPRMRDWSMVMQEAKQRLQILVGKNSI